MVDDNDELWHFQQLFVIIINSLHPSLYLHTYIYRRYLNLLFMSIERLSLSTGVRQIIVNFALENFETQSNLLRSYKIEIVWMKLHTKKLIET